MAYPNKGLELAKVEDKKEDEEKLSWADLLPELLSSILSRLFMGDYVTFLATCKSWQSTSLISRRLLQISDLPLPQYPYLMFFNTMTRLVNFYHPICNVFYEVDIPKLYKIDDIRFVKENWLVITLESHDIFMFNPFTQVRIDLPDIPLELNFFSKICFFSQPTSPDFVVYGFRDCNDWMDICKLKFGEDDWTIVSYDTKWFELAPCTPVVCNGLVYFLCMGGSLKILYPKNSNLSFTVRGKPRQRFQNTKNLYYMVESEGELFLVVVNSERGKVDVFKLDFQKMYWKDVASLGDTMLFVSFSSSFSEKAVVKGAGNKVYFPSLNDRSGVFYSLKTKRFHNITSTGSFSRSNYFGEQWIKQATWVKFR